MTGLLLILIKCKWWHCKWFHHKQAPVSAVKKISKESKRKNSNLYQSISLTGNFWICKEVLQLIMTSLLICTNSCRYNEMRYFCNKKNIYQENYITLHGQFSLSNLKKKVYISLLTISILLIVAQSLLSTKQHSTLTSWYTTQIGRMWYKVIKEDTTSPWHMLV